MCIFLAEAYWLLPDSQFQDQNRWRNTGSRTVSLLLLPSGVQNARSPSPTGTMRRMASSTATRTTGGSSGNSVMGALCWWQGLSWWVSPSISAPLGHQSPLTASPVPHGRSSSGLSISQSLSLIQSLNRGLLSTVKCQVRSFLKDLTVQCWVWVGREAGRRHSTMWWRP